MAFARRWCSSAFDVKTLSLKRVGGPSGQPMPGYRQRMQAAPGSGVDCIAKRGGDKSRRRLSDAARFLTAIHEEGIDARSLIDAHQTIRIEVGLLDAAALDVDLAPQ